jgi:hypothetical protein
MTRKWDMPSALMFDKAQVQLIRMVRAGVLPRS